jgi:UBX domain
MAQIEADKTERKARERARKEEAELARQAELGAPSSSIRSSQQPSAAHHSGTEAHISVRLLDGATIRNVFPAAAKLDPDIRSWISSNYEELKRQPYTFKQMLAPTPARALSTSDEQMEIRELGFVPSTTLVLVPVQKGSYVEAYSGGSGLIHSLLSLPYNVATGAYSLVASVVGAVTGIVFGALGWSANPASPEEHEMTDAATATSGSAEVNSTGLPAQRSTIRIRTLADQRAQDRRLDQEFYNGNQVSTCISLELLKILVTDYE